MEASKLRLRIATLSIAAIVAALMVVPALASATVVDDVLNGLGLGAGQGGQQAPSGKGHGSTKSGVPPDYVPPLHGTNPHGEGDAATISLAPTGPNPVTGTPGQPESVVLGSSKGEQNADGTYHGHINVLSLFGNELISVDSTPGRPTTVRSSRCRRSSSTRSAPAAVGSSASPCCRPIRRRTEADRPTVSASLPRRSVRERHRSPLTRSPRPATSAATAPARRRPAAQCRQRRRSRRDHR